MSDQVETRDAVQERLTRLFGERLRADWPSGEADITEIEERVARIEAEVSREVTGAMIQEQTGKRTGNRVDCPCGKGLAKYSKQATIPLVTAFGRIPTERAYFYCPKCRDGHCPQDHAWRIGPGRSTPTVQSVVSYLAVKEAYGGVPWTLKRTQPTVHLGTTNVEQIAQAMGDRLRQARPLLTERATRPLVVAVDGTIILTRAGGKEVRCGVIYEPEWGAARTPDACAGLRKEYFATLESRDKLIRTVCAQVERRRPTPETKVSAMGDGAPWIWAGYAKHLPNRVEILDFYHLSEHLEVVGAAWYGEGTLRKKLWVAEMKGALKGGGPGTLLRSVRAWKPKTKKAQQIKTRELGYFRKNRERMNYHVYLRDGLAIGTGSVEGACKFVVGGRFKGAGMRWNVETAEPLLHLRAAILSYPDLDLRHYAGRPSRQKAATTATHMPA